MEVESQEQSNTWEDYVDWKKKPAIKGRHGGMLAASFVLVWLFLASASNLVLYLIQHMHFSPSKAANHVTNFMGDCFSSCSSWWLLIRCFLYHLSNLPHQCTC
ncbi:putative proton-dependent oligopeptide transporter family, MFS transporter superfamily [Helianthus debilis subsp. tardiflorus]